ncbi:MAG: hypothetical protein AAGF14_03350, partial [Pseudomonadota bacterium]
IDLAFLDAQQFRDLFGGQVFACKLGHCRSFSCPDFADRVSTSCKIRFNFQNFAKANGNQWLTGENAKCASDVVSPAVL